MLPTPPSKALVAPLLPQEFEEGTMLDGATRMDDGAATVTTAQPTGAAPAGVAHGDRHAFPVDVGAPASAAAAGTAPTGTAAPASSSSSSAALGGRCSTPISVHFRHLTAVLQDKDWRGRVKKQHTIVKVSGRTMRERCDIRHSKSAPIPIVRTAPHSSSAPSLCCRISLRALSPAN